MKSRIRQLVSMVCSLALCAALVPAAVFAEAPEDAPAAAPAVTPAAAQIGDTTYPGLQRAVNAAQAGATITLLSDIHETVFIPKDARITLDLNGKTVSTEEAPVLVVEGGSLTVRDSSAENFHPNKNADGTYSVHTHQFGPWVTTVEPGPSTQGKQVQTCSVCGYEMAKTLPPTGNSGQPQKDPAKPDPAPVKPTPAPAPCFGAGRLRRPACPAYNRNHKGTRREQLWASSFWTWTECCARPGALPSAACSAVPWTASSLTRGRCSGCGGW